jgi:hypothetical protein
MESLSGWSRIIAEIRLWISFWANSKLLQATKTRRNATVFLME